jgi:hypothetical protein
MQIPLDFNQRDLGHGAAATNLHPVVLVALLVAIVLLLVRPRKYLIVPLLLCIFLVPRAQQVLIVGAHFYVRLILILAGSIRLITGKFKIAGGLNGIDKVFICWVLYRVFAVTLTNWPNSTMEQIFFLLQSLCGYFLLRYLIQDEEDLLRTAKTLAITAAILGASMLYEHIFSINLFGTYLGGAPITPEIREGTARAQATFGHSILAGSFGATLVPLFVWLWKRKSRMVAIIGIIGSTLMVFSTNSSTPLMAYIAGVLGILAWPMRRGMRFVRWGIVVTIAALAFVMNAPVWFVIAHINVIGSSGGYDRAFLIDTCMRHIWDWWLIGTNQNGNWGYDMWDLSDQFVAEAEMGGLFTLICFITIIAGCFSRLGKTRKPVEPKEQWLLWCLGSVMLANIFAFFGVAYWDQTQIWWFAFLAMISAATIPVQSLSLENAASRSATSMFAQYQKPAEARGWSQFSTNNKSAD